MIPTDKPQTLFKYFPEILYTNTCILKVKELYSVCFESRKLFYNGGLLFVKARGHHTNNFDKYSWEFSSVLNRVKPYNVIAVIDVLEQFHVRKFEDFAYFRNTSSQLNFEQMLELCSTDEIMKDEIIQVDNATFRIQ